MKTELLNSLEKKFLQKGILHYGILLFKPEVAVEFIAECEKNSYKLLGIDTFKLVGEFIQPDMENSIDYSSGQVDLKRKSAYELGVEFVKQREDKGLMFEIVCSNVGNL